MSINTISEVKKFSGKLGDALAEANADYRTLGASKRLHAIAQAMGFKNWHECSARLNQDEFILTLRNTYGLSEAYADAAWLTLSNEGRKNGRQSAVAYAERFGIEAVAYEDRKVDEKLVKTNESVLSDLLAAGLNEESSYDFVYGEALSSYSVEFKLGDSVSVVFEASSDYGQIMSGKIVSRGFGTKEVRHLSKSELDQIVPVFETAVMEWAPES